MIEAGPTKNTTPPSHYSQFPRQGTKYHNPPRHKISREITPERASASSTTLICGFLTTRVPIINSAVRAARWWRRIFFMLRVIRIPAYLTLNPSITGRRSHGRRCQARNTKVTGPGHYCVLVSAVRDMTVCVRAASHPCAAVRAVLHYVSRGAVPCASIMFSIRCGRGTAERRVEQERSPGWVG